MTDLDQLQAQLAAAESERDALKNKAATSEEFLQLLNGQVAELVKLLDPTFDGPPDAWSLFDLVNLAKSKLSATEARVAEADAAAQRYSDAMAEAQREAIEDLSAAEAREKALRIALGHIASGQLYDYRACVAVASAALAPTETP